MASPIIYALLGGILPALVWLLFWLREDWQNPEPNRLILRTFLFGMLAVPLVLPFEWFVEQRFDKLTTAIIIWAVLEESFKLAAGYFGGLHTIEDNEPIDPLVYMITAALGFVAVENALFILAPIIGDNVPQTIITTNLRFIGASLLHVVASGVIGASISFAFYKSYANRVKGVVLGLFWAILLHAGFNLAVLSSEGGLNAAFFGAWVGVVALLLTFERVKRIAPER